MFTDRRFLKLAFFRISRRIELIPDLFDQLYKIAII